MSDTPSLSTRTTPYTKIGIKRVPCIKCGKPSQQQWQICADNRVYRGVCTPCDVELNLLVLKWAGFKDWKIKINAYKSSLETKT